MTASSKMIGDLIDLCAARKMTGANYVDRTAPPPKSPVRSKSHNKPFDLSCKVLKNLTYIPIESLIYWRRFERTLKKKC
jgi:hypothetical protein